MIWEWDMWPAAGSAGANVANNVSGNAVLLRQVIQQSSSTRAGANIGNVRFRKQAVAARRAPMRRERSMTRCVSHVLCARCPTEVFRGIVMSNPIPMGDFIPASRPGPIEGDAHEGVHLSPIPFPVREQLDGGVSVCIAIGAKHVASNGALAADCSTHPAMIGNLVQRVFRYLEPFFDSMIRVSHVALLSRCGQGRALLTQRFRPALYGRNRLILQGIAT